ncbi:MAG TPA: GntR family transcriptional regulator [Rhizobiaceae bacterium]|nr:GntR family transcriptional regulator [Rhizobiaceae bacterium]
MIASNVSEAMSQSSLSFRTPGAMLSVAEQIADRICNAILSGELKPGQRIAEIPLAQTFQVSRGPVREALRLLEHEGLVTFSPRRGAQVTALTIEEVEQLFDIRAALSALAAERAAENITGQELAELRQVITRMGQVAKATEDVHEYAGLSARAGQIIAHAAHNPRLLGMIQSLSRQTLRYAHLGLSTSSRRQESARYWKALLEAIEKRDTAKAAQVNAETIRLSRDAAVQLLRDES